MGDKVKGCDGKRSYKTRKIALQTMGCVKRKRGVENLNVYKCVHCKGFHIGHKGKWRRGENE